MRYFTRERFQVMQAVSQAYLDERLPRTEWHEAAEAYAAYQESISSRIPRDVRVLTNTNLHDYQIVQVVQAECDIKLVLGSPWKKPRFQTGVSLHFTGCRKSTLESVHEGQGIVADEVLLIDDNVIEYAALLDRDEFAVRFAAVQVRDWSA